MLHSHCINDLLNIPNWFYRQNESGSYILTPLGLRYVQKICSIIKKYFNDWEEVKLPILQNKSIWESRMEKFGDIIFKVDNEQILAPTNEILAMQYYKQTDNKLNKFYQIHWKFRKELRYQHDLYRTKEFLMFDGYSFGDNVCYTQFQT